ncbi:hypothetical protein [Lactiplantibacillus plantarum]|uniref:hypothetical protein n=1 Tax=Lactiplantibacillus plantarum TaxID=1590 RepID=UPI001BA6ED7D|nr:hypothetical protein [Lactiplantibacillus plantarum]MBS0955895.1 hypothetical protein [Lactiplantibacillus plantarum]
METNIKIDPEKFALACVQSGTDNLDKSLSTYIDAYKIAEGLKETLAIEDTQKVTDISKKKYHF